MLRWRSKQKAEDVVRLDIERARAVLPLLRLKLDKEGPAVARNYGEGVVEVCQALARALGVPMENALSGKSLQLDQLTAATRDLRAAEDRCRAYLGGENEASRILASKLIFGCQVLYHLYRLRFHAHSSEAQGRGEAESLAETYSSLTRVLSEIALKDRRG